MILLFFPAGFARVPVRRARVTVRGGLTATVTPATPVAPRATVTG